MVGIDYDPIKSIERDISSEGKYTISCSSINPSYRTGMAISLDGYAIGIVLSKGHIYAAYHLDADTVATHKLYRTPRSTNRRRIPVRLALMSDTFYYNELLPKNWKVGAVFYTTKTPLEVLKEVAKIVIKYDLKLCSIDENKKKWIFFEYNKKLGRFEKT
ncbi:hypothetical protein HYU22_03100 [Candidatus Woesearchaeota archaeon]|nr:hypothetical protein [Candidatus Woesearchaeota archaeon]